MKVDLVAARGAGCGEAACCGSHKRKQVVCREYFGHVVGQQGRIFGRQSTT